MHPREGAATGSTQGDGWVAVGRHVAPSPDGPRVEDGRLREAQGAAKAAQGPNCGRMSSITNQCVVNAMMRLAPWHVRPATEKTSK